MAVGPTRALLAAHFQTSLARSTKEMSRQGTWALVFLVVVLALFVATPITFGLFMAGLGLGGTLQDPQADKTVQIIGVLLALLVGVGGFMGGLLGGAKKLSWERYRAFPLGRTRLMLAELVAGLGDVLVLGLTLALVAFLLGLAISQPRLLPLLPIVFLVNLALLLVLQLLLGSLAQRLAKRLKLMAGLLLGTVWLASLWMGRLAPRKGAPMDPDLESKLSSLLDGALRLFAWLPTTQAAQGLQSWLDGHYAAALYRQLPALATLLLLGALAARWLDREQEALAPVTATGKERLWSFATAEGGIAHLQLRTLLSSHHGKLGFLMPVLTVILLRGPLAMFKSQAVWALPGAFAYLALFGNQFQFNQFGLDGHGVKGLFLLPVGMRQLIDGKLRGFALYQGLQAVLLIALLIPLFHPPVLEVAASLALAGCYFLAQSAIGAFTSGWMPRRIDRHSLANNQMPLPLVLVGIGVSMASTLVFGGIFVLLKWLVPGFLLPGMGLLFGLCFGLHRLSLPFAATYLDGRREVLVERLG